MEVVRLSTSTGQLPQRAEGEEREKPKRRKGGQEKGRMEGITEIEPLSDDRTGAPTGPGQDLSVSSAATVTGRTFPLSLKSPH